MYHVYSYLATYVTTTNWQPVQFMLEICGRKNWHGITYAGAKHAS